MSLGSVATAIFANSFTIIKLPSKDYYQYDVVFVPELKNGDRRIQFVQHLQNVVAPNIFHPRIVYDGRALAYSPGRPLPLAGGRGETFSINMNSNVQVPLESRGSYQIKLTQTSGMPVQPTDVNSLIHNQQQSTGALIATNLMQLIIRQGPNLHNTNNGRAYFPNDRSQIRDIGGALELWRGIYHSIRPAPQKMILTIDTCSAAVYLAGDLFNVALSFLGATDIRALNLSANDPKFKQLERFLKNVQISIPSPRGQRTKSIRGLIERAGKYVFSKNDGQESTVALHFQETYNIRIRYSDMLGVNISGKRDPPSVIPAELCQVIPGQLYKRKIPEYLTAKVVEFSKIKPQDRFRKISQSVEAYHRSEFVVESGMEIDRQPLQINARRINVPRVLYGGGSTANVRDGGWNVVGKQLSSPKSFNNWAVIDFVADQLDMDQIRDRVRALSSCCEQLGMGPSVAPLAMERGNPHLPEESLVRLFQGVRGRANPESFILLVILPNSAGPIRNAVKHWGDITQGVMTQCLRLEKFISANNQYWNNVALKINARLGGYNSTSDSGVLAGLQSQPFMIVGADVGHPGPGVAKPSVTGLVFSYDKGATQYAALTEVQQPRVEIIASLQNMMEQALHKFIECNKIPPRRVVFFRDGVSEGEYSAVATAELEAIQAAIKTIVGGRDYQILVTFVVVGKRHHSVFFPRNNNEGDRKGNCHPGLVVENEVTGPMKNDFYLQSHAALQGTPRSAHYIILHDDIFNGNLQKIQELAFTLCHVYAKATRSVSIPAPVYYADLVCSRGAFHMSPDAQGLQFDDSASSASGGSSFNLNSWRIAFQSINKALSNRMYFL